MILAYLLLGLLLEIFSPLCTVERPDTIAVSDRDKPVGGVRGEFFLVEVHAIRSERCHFLVRRFTYTNDSHSVDYLDPGAWRASSICEGFSYAGDLEAGHLVVVVASHDHFLSMQVLWVA